MAIISRIGRKSWSVRLLIGTLYVLLSAGALAMIYPFSLMLAGSTKSASDAAESRMIPPFWYKEQALYSKAVECYFNESLEMMNITYDGDFASFQTAELPKKPNRKLVDDWKSFLKESNLPAYSYTASAISAPVSRGVLPFRLRDFKAQLIKEFNGSMNAVNERLGTEFVNWNAFYVLPEDYLQRRNKPENSPFDQAFLKFKQSLPEDARYYFSPEGFYKVLFLKTQYSKDIENYNKEHGTSYKSWGEVHLDLRLPAGPGRTKKEREDWESFVRTILNLLWVRADREAAPFYHDFLKAKFRHIESLNRLYHSDYESFEAVPLVEEPPSEGLRLSDWDAFIQGWKDPDTRKEYKLPASMLRIHSTDFLFRDYLEEKYSTLAAANAALETDTSNWMQYLPPQRDAYYYYFRAREKELKKEFTFRNFTTVFDYMLLHGRGIANTAIYCSLAILAALIVNPLAAYALSRYKPPSAYKILLFLMLTMAFPPMVTQIPVFLMLREFNLLNSFYALILPGLANGYSIFLLKGFFDSLPKELYESADLDGAGEFRIFWQLTMSLSTPILAVVALGAFTAAYSNFMMALLICQDQNMWTLMPWLYQLGQRSGEGVVFASLLVAALPTFLVFAFCQNIILRGIVVPVEK